MKASNYTPSPLLVAIASGLLAQAEAAHAAGLATAQPGWLARIVNTFKGARA